MSCAEDYQGDDMGGGAGDFDSGNIELSSFNVINCLRMERIKIIYELK